MTESRQERMLEVAEAAKMLNVPKGWLYAAARNGQFPRVLMGRHVRIRQSDVDAWIKSGGKGLTE